MSGPALWLRLNPDFFSVDGVHTHVSTSERAVALVKHIKESKSYPGASQVKLTYICTTTASCV